MKIYRMNTDIAYKSGSKLKDDDGNIFEALSSIDLEWLLGEDFQKSKYKHKYYLSLKFLGNFEKKATIDSKEDKESTVENPIRQ